MKLSDQAITAIKKPSVRRELASALDCTDQSVNRYIKNNEFNGELTKVAALAVIRKETGLTDSEILQDVEVKASQN